MDEVNLIVIQKEKSEVMIIAKGAVMKRCDSVTIHV
jgi:hypothetical protein